MKTTRKIKSCSNFKAVDNDIFSMYRRSTNNNCKNCAYFSARNCGMDVADSIEPMFDFLC